MLLKDAKDMTVAELKQILLDGGKVVVYSYTISILIMTFKRSSSPYIFRAGENRVNPGLMFSLMTLLLGWWGIPWGPIYSIQTLWQNFSGGIDITAKILATFEAPKTAPVTDRVPEELHPRANDS